MNHAVMMPNPDWLRWTARALVPILAALGASTAGFAKTIELRLSEGQNEVVRTLSLVDMYSPVELDVKVTIEGEPHMFEFEARVVGTAIGAMQVDGKGVIGTVVSTADAVSEFHHRELMTGYSKPHLRLDTREGHLIFEDELIVSLRRVTGYCSMSAQVSGDVNRTAFGDVAYYNVFEEGVRAGMASGTALDPGANEALGDLMEFAEFLQNELDLPVEDASDEEKPGTEDSGDWDTSGTDTFGLSLAEVDMEGDPQATAGIAGALSVLGESFSLGASGVSGKLDGTTGRYDVKISSLMVAPGVLDANVSGVKFLYKPGLPGSAFLKIKDEGGGVISGDLVADVYTEKPYNNGRKLYIRVVARFVALEGAYSCN